MIREMIRPGGMFSPMMRSMIQTIRRYFTNLLGVNQYWEFQDTQEFVAGDSFEFLHQFPTSAVASQELLCDSDDGLFRAFIALNTSGLFAINTLSTTTISGVVKVTGDAYPTDGKFHLVKMDFTSAAKLKYLGVFNTAAGGFSKRIFANPKATLNSPTVLTPSTVLGPEEVDINAWTNLDAATVDEGTITLDGTNAGTVVSARQDAALINGRSYLVSFVIEEISGSVDVYLDGAFLYKTATGSYSSVVTATATGRVTVRATGGSTAIISGISVEELISDTQTYTLANGPGNDTEESIEGGKFITRINVVDADIELFQLSGNKTQWDNISPPPQQLPAVIEIA